MMKKYVFFLLLVILFLLSSCDYTASQYDDMKEQLENEWIEKYGELEEKYYSLSAELESVYDDILKTDDDVSTLYLYFDENSISYDEAYDAYDSLSTKLRKYY